MAGFNMADLHKLFPKPVFCEMNFVRKPVSCRTLVEFGGKQPVNERNFLFLSSGGQCALPVAYLSNVTPYLSRCSRKTPASAFTPNSHSHISFSCPPRFSTPPRLLQGENCMSPGIYKNCSEERRSVCILTMSPR